MVFESDGQYEYSSLLVVLCLLFVCYIVLFTRLISGHLPSVL